MITGYIQPCILSEEEMQKCQDVMLKARPVIDAWATKLYGKRKIRKFRQDYVAGKLFLPIQDKQAIDDLFSISDKILASVVKMLAKIAWSFASKSGHDYNDCFQEACYAAYDAIFYYNGKSKFVTLVVIATKRQLFHFIRTASPLSSLDRMVVKDRGDARKLMEEGRSFEEAVKELGLNKKRTENCKKAMAQVFHHENCLDKMAKKDTEKDDALSKAIEKALLTKKEKEVITAVLEEESKSDMARKYGVSRQMIDHIYKNACKKIKRAYLREAA